MTYSWDISNPAELEPVISCLEGLSKQYKVIFLIGDLGSGKTTLVKYWMGIKGVQDEITSPTFSIINEYLSNEGSIYHMDCYRLNSINEALEIGIEEYLDSGELCLIEWPQVISELIATPYVSLTIRVDQNNGRNYSIKTIDNPS